MGRRGGDCLDVCLVSAMLKHTSNDVHAKRGGIQRNHLLVNQSTSSTLPELTTNNTERKTKIPR